MSVGQVLTASGGQSGERVLRYTVGERVNHWVAGLSYVYLLITGLGFYWPGAFWLTILVGGAPTARFWHPWVGLLFTASVALMYRMWRDDMRTTKADRTWYRSIRHYIRNEDEDLPAIDRFNLGQKQFFWVMFWSALALLVSGLILWWVDSIPAGLHFLLYLAILVHVIAALLTIGAFIIHVYMGTAMVRGGFTSIIRGEVTVGWAKLHHRLWYERIAGASSRRQ